MQSETPANVCFTGSVKVYVGSMKLTAGNTSFEKYASLSFVSVRDITPPMSYSLPVAAMVIMSTMGTAAVVGLRPQTMSHASSTLSVTLVLSVPATPAIALVQSSTEPPPTASITSMSLS